MLKIAVLDDEPLFLDRFIPVLEKQFGGQEEIHISVFHDSTPFRKSASQFDLIFLDIDMPDVSGIMQRFSLLERYIVMRANHDLLTKGGDRVDGGEHTKAHAEGSRARRCCAVPDILSICLYDCLRYVRKTELFELFGDDHDDAMNHLMQDHDKTDTAVEAASLNVYDKEGENVIAVIKYYKEP